MVDVRASHVALPRERRVYASVETTYGTRINPAGADAVRIMNGLLGSEQPARIERVDNRQTRSIESKITGASPPVEWNLEGYLIPSGAAGTAPDWGALLTAALGTETIVGGVSVTYTPNDMQGALGSLTLVDEQSGIYMNSIAGAWVEELTLRGSGGDPPMVVANGLASSSVKTGRGEVTTVAAAVVTPVDPPGVEGQVQAGSVVAFVEPSDGKTIIDDNGGAGFVVDSVDIGAGTYTLNASPAGVSPGDIIIPFTPTEVTAGSPSTGIDGSLTLDGVTLPLLTWELTVKNNIQPHADEAFQANATGYHEDNRQVTGQVTLRVRADQVRWLVERYQFSTFPVVITVGSVAGAIMTITMSTAELGFANVDSSQPESSVMTIPFQALGTGNEISIAFT